MVYQLYPLDDANETELCERLAYGFERGWIVEQECARAGVLQVEFTDAIQGNVDRAALESGYSVRELKTYVAT